MCTRRENLPSKLLSRKGNLLRPTLQHNKNNFTMKVNMPVLEPVSVFEKSVKHPQQTALPPVTKGSKKKGCKKKGCKKKGCKKNPNILSNVQPAVLPAVPKGPQKTPADLRPSQHTKLPPIHQSIRQHAPQEGMQCNKDFPQERSNSKETQKVDKMSTAIRTPLSPETVLRVSKSCLTEYELREIKYYKQVWYLGKKDIKIFPSKVTETQKIKSLNYGYDTVYGNYRAMIHDHLAYRFEILEAIGKGYSGQVLKCRDHKTMELVAIKIIGSKHSVHEQGKAELKILETLRKLDEDNTANIVHMKEHFYFRNHFCITFELLEKPVTLIFGKDLLDAFYDKKEQSFTEEELRKYTIEVLKCLEMLRKNGIVHGDIKPMNVLLYKDGSDKLAAVCDFGGSYFVNDRDRPSMHTLHYRSPEVLLDKKCSPAIDMWSLGCMLAKLYLGVLVFVGFDEIDVFNCIIEVLGVPPKELLVEAPKATLFFSPDGIPLRLEPSMCRSTPLAKCLKSKNAAFVDFIERCLEYDPTKRITPEEALQHPWIQKAKTKPVTSARRTRSDAPVPKVSKQPPLLKREKVAPLQLQPIKNQSKGGSKLKGI